MASSISRITTVHGSQFGERVGRADEVAPPAPAVEPRLPDRTMELLIDLQTFTEQDKAEWDQLVWERDALNKRTLSFVLRMREAALADLEAKHESLKTEIREQGKVLRGFEKTIAEDTQQFVAAQNRLALAQSAAHEAEENLRGLSRFAPKAEIAEAKKRVDVAAEKMEKAERKAAEWGQHLNVLKAVTVPAENKKLTDLLDREVELDAQLSGRDPFLARYGFQQR